MGWIPGTKEGGEVENLLPDFFVTDACCSWKRLAFLTNDGECVLWSDYTNEQSHPTKVKASNRKFKAAGCLESSCILLSGKFYFMLKISTEEKDHSLKNMETYIIKNYIVQKSDCHQYNIFFLHILSYLVKCLHVPVYYCRFCHA